MARDGYIEPKSNGRLGKRIIHSDATQKKLVEVKKALQIDFMEVQVDESLNGFQKLAINQRDMSTCGNLQSIGSDLTRTKCRSEAHQNGSVRSGDHTVSKGRDHVTTPTSKAVPAASRESGIPGYEKGGANGNVSVSNEDPVICSRPSQDKRSRKASTVREPMIQYMKRQKLQAA